MQGIEYKFINEYDYDTFQLEQELKRTEIWLEALTYISNGLDELLKRMSKRRNNKKD